MHSSGYCVRAGRRWAQSGAVKRKAEQLEPKAERFKKDG
jgi:hypothetical protein